MLITEVFPINCNALNIIMTRISLRICLRVHDSTKFYILGTCRYKQCKQYYYVTNIKKNTAVGFDFVNPIRQRIH